MRTKLIARTLLILLLSSAAFAEIYETTDEQGNTVFTDTPSREAEVVDLPEANIADSVEPAPRPAAEAAPPRSPSSTKQQATDNDAGEEDEDNVYIIGDNYDERLEEKAARERRQEVLEGERPHEVLDADPPRDIREADRVDHARPAPHRAPHVAPRR